MQCSGTSCTESFCAFGCFRANEVLVRNLVYHIVQNPNEIDDLVQEVFLKAYQSIGSFRGGSFRAYLARIARNHSYDWLRRKRARSRITYVELLPDAYEAQDGKPEEQLIERETVAEMRVLLRHLKGKDREILMLKHVHGFSYDEIATVVGMNPGAVRTRLSRARQKMVELVEGREQHETSELG